MTEQISSAFEFQGQSIEERVSNMVMSEVESAKKAAGSWKLPFIIFLVFIVVGGGVAYYKWQEWQKKFHYL